MKSKIDQLLPVGELLTSALHGILTSTAEIVLRVLFRISSFDIYLILQYKRLDLYDVHTRVPSTDARKTHGSKRNALIGSHLPLSDFVKMKLTGQFANCIGFNNAHDILEFRGL